MSSQSNSLSRSAFAVIPAPVLYSKQLNDAEKIIFGHISNLCNEAGYCYATNQYLAELSGKSMAAIKRAVKQLTDLNFIIINHLSKGKHDQRQITLSQFPKVKEKEEGSSFVSHPQLTNELPGGSKMSHIIIKEEYINKNTTTADANEHDVEKPAKLQKSSSSFKCKNKIQKLENLSISDSQKQKIYRYFDEKQILKGLSWLENIGKRENPGAALYDAIKHGYEPKKSPEELAKSNQKYVQTKLGRYEDQVIKGYKISLCRQYVEFSAPSGTSHCFDYSFSSFKTDLDNFCAKLGVK